MVADLGPTTQFRHAGLSPATTAIPDSLVQDSRRRLAFTMNLVAGVFALYFVLFNTIWAEFRTTFGFVHAVIAMLTGFMPAFFFRRPRSAQVIVAIGSGWVILHCIGLSISNYSNVPALDQPSAQISWICVFILLLPFLLPARPRVIGFVAFLTACTDPLGWLLTPLVDTNPLPTSFTAVLSLMMPPFVCWLMAWGLSGVFFRLGREVAKARTLGAYELTERLGMGGMGEVWKAEHRLLARPAAVKLIQADVNNHEMAARFEREAQATAALESPHTVELYDFGVADDGTLYYVMELLRGQDLESVVAEFGPMSANRVVHVLLQACESLGEAHRAGLVHRDVKPANLFLCRKGARVDFLKVLDFGLVKATEGAPEEVPNVQLTLDEKITGTPAYLSPEAITGEPPIGPHSDLYALGCVAHYLLTGKPIFDGKTVLAVASAHLHETPTPPSEHVDDVPPALDALVLDLLAKSPDDRPATAEIVAERLGAIDLPRWTQADAREWWAVHLADVAQVPTGDTGGLVRSIRPPAG